MSFHAALTANQRAFLAAYVELCSLTRAAASSEQSRTNHYRWLRENEEYAAAFRVAKEEAADSLEDEAVRRAYEGVEKPVTIAGERDIIREYDTTLLIFLLKGMRPEKYRENRNVYMSGGDGGPVKTEVKLTLVEADNGT